MPSILRWLLLALLVHATGLHAQRQSKALAGAQVLEPAISGEGAIGDRFGRTLAWSADTLVVGAIGDEVSSPLRPSGVSSGTVSVYREAAGGLQFESLLVPSESSGDDRFGFAVSLSGELLAVGAPFEDADGQEDRGVVYVFMRSGTAWQEVARLVAPDGAAADLFGYSVAIDAAGLVVGAPGANAGQGRAYRYARSGPDFALSATLDAAAPGDAFGHAVALAADAVYVAAPQRAAGPLAGAGAVFCFARAGGACATPVLAAATPSADARFGGALAYQSGRLLVGAAGEAVGAQARQGAVYAYDAGAAAPILERARLVAPGGDADDAFGASLAIDGATIAIGAPGVLAAEGAAYAFVESGAGYAFQQSFSEPDAGLLDLYGAAVALRGERLAIGVELDNLAPNRGQGSVATWSRTGTVWTEGARLATGDGASREQFGSAVAIDGALVVVGSALDDPAIDQDDAGTATVYRHDGTTWLREVRLAATDAFTQDLFGFSVDASAGRIVVGAPRAIVAGRLDQGAAYVFRHDGVAWIQEAKLVAPDGASDEFFGAAVAIDADTVLVGAPFQSGVLLESGAGYVFRRTGTTWAFEAKLTSPGFGELGAAGLAVALDGDVAILGAPDTTIGDAQVRGLVHAFARGAGGWRAAAAISAPDGTAGDAFGSAVALDGTDLAVGAAQDSEAGHPNAGSAYLFSGADSVDSWTPVVRLVAPAAADGDFFGASIAISAGRVLVGVPGFDLGAPNAGGAVLYARAGNTWGVAQVLQAPSVQRSALFGNAVALAPLAAVVGEPLRDRVNPDEGAAYAYGEDDRLLSDGFE